MDPRHHMDRSASVHSVHYPKFGSKKWNTQIEKKNATMARGTSSPLHIKLRQTPQIQENPRRNPVLISNVVKDANRISDANTTTSRR